MSSTTILMSCPPDFRADLILRAREDGSLRTDAACEREADKLGVLYEVRQRLHARAAFAANDGDTGEVALSPYERWMAGSNLETVRSTGVSAAEQAALLRANGYHRVADAVERDEFDDPNGGERA